MDEFESRVDEFESRVGEFESRVDEFESRVDELVVVEYRNVAVDCRVDGFVLLGHRTSQLGFLRSATFGPPYCVDTDHRLPYTCDRTLNVTKIDRLGRCCVLLIKSRAESVENEPNGNCFLQNLCSR